MKLPIERVDVKAVQAAMTLSYQPMGAEEPSYLENYRTESGYLCVPRQYGIALCRREGIEFDDMTSQGYSAVFPKVPAPREYQVEALQSISECMDQYYDFVFRARTAFGKTFCGIYIAAQREISTIIVVDQENLKDQWIDTLVNLFGFARGDIGIIQGKKCDYKGKAVTIAMVQTLSQKELPQEVYDYFGFMIVDECHIIGAPTFSRVLMQFSAAYRLGLSATPKRRDGLQKVLDYSLGRVRVQADDEHDESSVYVAEHGTVYSWYANTSPKIGRFLSEVAEDGSRNLLLAESAAYLYDTGRDILVLSDRIEQLKNIKSLCYYLGIPEEDMGLYAGYDPRYCYEKDATPTRKPKGYERGLEYSPVSLKLISKRIKKTTLAEVKTKARIIFSTYGMFSKGVDEPRLNGGIDATPRSLAEQVHGRILRKVSGKRRSIWITVVDTASYRSMFSLTGRLAGYATNNAVISKWSLDGGKQICDATELKRETLATVSRLKSLRIQTNKDGLNTLETLMQRTQSEMQRVRATKPVDPPRRSLPMGSSFVGRRAK